MAIRLSLIFSVLSVFLSRLIVEGHLIQFVQNFPCVEHELRPGCKVTCNWQPDITVVVFRVTLPCSWLSEPYRHPKNWNCIQVDMSKYSNSTVFILDSMESSHTFNYYGDPVIMSRISACKGYHSSCQWRFPFIRDLMSGFNWDYGVDGVVKQLRNPSILRSFATNEVGGQQFISRVRKSVKGNVMYMASSFTAKSNRGKYVKQLMKHIRVDCWGKEHKNVDTSFMSPHKKNVTRETLEKLVVMSEYKFYLAFENSISEDYISEKFWETFAIGVVPVVMAHDSIYKMLPSRDSIINVNDFKSPKELASYLTLLTKNPDLYQKHLNWRNEPFPEGLMDVVQKAATLTWDDDVCNSTFMKGPLLKPQYDYPNPPKKAKKRGMFSLFG